MMQEPAPTDEPADDELTIKFSQDRDTPDDSGNNIYLADGLLILLFSGIALFGIHLFPFDTPQLRTLTFSSILSPGALWLLLTPLPIAYTAAISRERFRKESLVGLFLLPGMVIDGKLGLFCLIIPVSILMASYKARSVYNGKNDYWMLFETGSVFILTTAVLVGGAVAYTASVNDSFRADFQQALTSKAVNTTTQYARSGSALDQQTQQFTRLARNTAETASEDTITKTEQRVLSRMDATGSFTQSQRDIVSNGFNNALQRVPANVSDTIAAQVEEQITQGQGGGQQDMQSLIRPRVEEAINDIFERRTMVGVAVFLSLVSLIMILKIPFQALALLYGAVIVLFNK